MNKIIRSAVLLGLGAVSLTKEKAEKSIKAFVKKGAISTKEGRALVKTVIAEGKREKSRIAAIVKTEGGKLKREAEAIAKKEVTILKARLAKVEKKGKAVIKKRKKK